MFLVRVEGQDSMLDGSKRTPSLQIFLFLINLLVAIIFRFELIVLLKIPSQNGVYFLEDSYDRSNRGWFRYYKYTKLKRATLQKKSIPAILQAYCSSVYAV